MFAVAEVSRMLAEVAALLKSAQVSAIDGNWEVGGSVWNCAALILGGFGSK